ncbi:glycoside hydrolase family 23 protein [Pholiota conissans]|uniref:Glycoside hydrolase family 23 protein n=1 Tax=Pholiota conissans TaxID=109636 RepID=A0A9P6D3H5_9AGAR|nr:glycoside hydrolase family 23 protein [Pholiota conissans]
MRLFTSALALFLSFVIAGASAPHGKFDIAARHNRLAQRAPSPLEARAAASTKKCINRKNKNALKSSTSAAPSSTKAITTTKPASTPKPATTTKKATTTPALAPEPVKQVTASGLIKVQSASCGPSGATKAITKLSGPNGNIDWLNCGFEGAGWNPPVVRMQDVITQSLSSALQSPSSPFKACSKYVSLFEKYGNQNGIAPIILASFAMQESSCNPETVGGAGEQGLMQITRDKCGGAPGGNCRDPDFNIRTAAKYFKGTLDDNNGNVLLSVGTYNGWVKGLTKARAFAAANTGCCRCQNNGDYLHQFFNGWCQNIDAYSAKLGKYFNLDRCG